MRWRSRFGAFHTRDPVLRYTHHLHFKYISNYKYVICLGIKEYLVRFRKNNQVYLNLPHVLKCCGSLISLQKGMHTKYRTQNTFQIGMQYFQNCDDWLTHTHKQSNLCPWTWKEQILFFETISQTAISPSCSKTFMGNKKWLTFMLIPWDSEAGRYESLEAAPVLPISAGLLLQGQSSYLFPFPVLLTLHFSHFLLLTRRRVLAVRGEDRSGCYSLWFLTDDYCKKKIRCLSSCKDATLFIIGSKKILNLLLTLSGNGMGMGIFYYLIDIWGSGERAPCSQGKM